jgi:beta-barrel assembly-enhancing protease
MKRVVVTAILAFAVVGSATSRAAAQGGVLGRISKGADDAKKVAKAVGEFIFTEEEERTLGQDVSAKLRDKYGVVQDRAVHRYVTLVGQVLAKASERANREWTFIVLDTDGINAFAAPGGYVHITRGALALIKDEAELADVLGHEIGHITKTHTINAIRKSKGVDVVANMTRQDFLREVANKVYQNLLENSFDRDDETESDREGIILANKAGYAPTGMAAFLTKLAERNKDLKEKSGMFASHPEAKARLSQLERTIKSQKLTSAALVAARYDQAINFTLVPISQIPQVPPPTYGAAAPAAQKSGGSGSLGLGGLNPLSGGKSGGAVSSAAARGANPDRDARGGPVKTPMNVTVTAAEIDAFRKGIS